MRYAPDSRLGKVDLAWVSLCIIDDLRNSLGGERCVREHDLRLPGDARNWRDIADEIEIELSVEAGIDCVRRPDQKERIAVRGAFTTAWVAILVPAPGRFSITNGWPRRSDSHCPISRATMSYPPPAAKPTMMCTGRDG